MNNKKNNLTYHDIKKSTNLSIGTISRFFNNGSISQKAKEKIEEYIKKTNYQPNIGAKLIKGYENCIYLIICSLEDSAILEITNSIIENFKKENINVYVVVSSYDPNYYLQTLEQTINRKPKTLILFTPTLNDKLRNKINEIEIDTFVYGDNSTNKPYIILDNKNYIFSVTNQIINSKKYDNIIYIGKNEIDFQTGKSRYEGFKDSIKNKKINHSSILIEKNSFFFLEEKLPEDKLITNSNEKTIIICGTHTIFEYLFFQKIKNKYRFHLTDIGYVSKYDYLDDSYKYKVFVDFFKIGYILYNNILENNWQNVVIKENIIKK